MDVDATVSAVKSAVELGYRHIDTATLYNTEPAVGLAVNELINSKLIARQDLFIATKVWLTLVVGQLVCLDVFSVRWMHKPRNAGEGGYVLSHCFHCFMRK